MNGTLNDSVIPYPCINISDLIHLVPIEKVYGSRVIGRFLLLFLLAFNASPFIANKIVQTVEIVMQAAVSPVESKRSSHTLA